MRTYSGDCDAFISTGELTKYYGRKPTDYETLRCGMNVLEAIIDGGIHAHRCRDSSRSGIGGMALVKVVRLCCSDARMDELAELGCDRF